MRRWSRILLINGLILAGATATTAKAQDVTALDPAGFGKLGISNYKGYGVVTDRGQGYWTGLYRAFDNTTESAYYSPAWSSINGAPLPHAAANGWAFSPPWSKNYRQRAVASAQSPPRRFGLFHRDR